MGPLVLVLVFGVLAYFSYLDFKSREVDDKLTYGFLAAAAIFQAASWVAYRDTRAFLFALGTGAVLFGIGYIMYLTQQWGGADVIVLAALGLIFGANTEFVLAYFIDIFMVAFVYSLVWAAFEAWRAPKVRKDFVDSVKKDFREMYMLMGMVGLVLVSTFVVSFRMFGSGAVLVAGTPLYWLLLIIPGSWLLLKFVKAVEVGCFRINRKACELVEYDLLIEDLWVEGEKIRRVPAEKAKEGRSGKDVLVDSSDPNGLTIEQVGRIQGLVKGGKLEDGFVVKWGIPLVPVFPLALAVALKWGNVLWLLFSAL